MTNLLEEDPAMEERLEGIPVIDVDTHITEPRDLWSSRLPSKFADRGPRVEVDEKTGIGYWVVDGHDMGPEMFHNMAGWREMYPSFPPTPEDADPAGWDPVARLRRMDEYGVYAQVLYPNIVGFKISAFMNMADRELALACVRAYNDFQTDFASADPKRLIPVANIPIWDVDAAVAELERCAAMGHRGVNFGPGIERIGLPPLASDHWTPLLSAAQDLELPVSFHIGFQVFTPQMIERTSNAQRKGEHDDPLRASLSAALLFSGNISGIGEVIMTRICHRFPRLNMISVESGYGYVPYLLDALDWEFVNSEAPRLYPDMLLPSEYFRRQVYATFWFESGIRTQVELYPDNVMFESDFPHPASLSPGPGSAALSPHDTIVKNLSQLSDETLRKVLHGTAARLYRL